MKIGDLVWQDRMPGGWCTVLDIYDAPYSWLEDDTGMSMGWGMPVIVTTAINPGTGLLGAFRLGAELYDREQAMIRMSEHHEDFFKRNMILVLGEERIAFCLLRPDAFVEINFDAAPS